MSKSTVTTAKNIRGLQVISPEGVVGVWQDKKDSDKFFVAITTKAAGWSEFTNRSALVGPLSTDEMLAQLASYKKRGEQTLAHVHNVLAQASTEETEVVEQVEETVTEQVIENTDPMFAQLFERACTRTEERNKQLVVEVTEEIEQITSKLNGDARDALDAIMLEKLTFNLHRKTVMVAALSAALA